MTLECFILYVIVFLYGITIGSFLNVCIYRIPKKESVVTVGSHCMSCNHKLSWVDLFPLFSWLLLRGRCRYCGGKISTQYPLVEAFNGIMYVLIFACTGWNMDGVCYCIMASALLVISVIDFRTMKIPVALEVAILVSGLGHLVLHLDDWAYYVIGFIAVGLFLLLCALVFRAVTGKSGLGLGDVELMACAGLCIGWAHGLLAILIGCLVAILIEGIRIVATKKKGKFAFGPYLSVGIMFALFFGDTLYAWYIQMLMV